MKTAFEQHLDQVPAEVRDVFYHQLRTCAVEDAYNVLLYAGVAEPFTVADVLAYKQSLYPPPPEPSPAEPVILPTPPPPPPAYAKYFLADVPQELRRELLDLCFQQRRHDALALLRENGFYQYDDVDLQAFYGWAPTNLPEPPAPPPISRPTPAIHHSLAMAPNPNSTIHNQASRSEHPAISAAQPEATAEHPQPGIQNPAPSLQVPAITSKDGSPPPADPPLSIPKRRGKVARLPKEIRTEVNLLLDDGKPYEEIVQFLEQKGFPGFNSVNLHNWKEGGFQDWRREQERLENQQLQREWITDLIAQTTPGEVNHLSLQLFSAQIMDTLFGLDTRDLKNGLGSNPRHYIALLNSVCRMNEHLADSEEYQAFAKQYRERKNRKKAGLSDETRRLIMDELRISLPQPATEQSPKPAAAHLNSTAPR
jgi:hypothetical protein